YDLLEHNNEDIRSRPLLERRELLAQIICGMPLKPSGDSMPIEVDSIVAGTEQQLYLPFVPQNSPSPLAQGTIDKTSDLNRALATCQRVDTRFRISPLVDAASWEELAQIKTQARSLKVEGLML